MKKLVLNVNRAIIGIAAFVVCGMESAPMPILATTIAVALFISAVCVFINLRIKKRL